MPNYPLDKKMNAEPFLRMLNTPLASATVTTKKGAQIHTYTSAQTQASEGDKNLENPEHF